MRNSLKYILAVAAILFSVTAFADGDQKDKSAIHAEKSRSEKNADGSYTLTIDTYVTGEQTVLVGEEEFDTEVDAIIVVDVSGSMMYTFGTPMACDLDKVKSKPVGYYSYRSGNSETTGRALRYNVSSWGQRWDRLQYRTTNSSSSWTDYGNSNKDKPDYMYVSRMGATMDAVNAFVDELASKTKDGITHRICIITFQSNDKQSTLVDWTEISKTDNSAIKNEVNSMSAYGGTYADDGLSLANTKANSFRTDRDHASNVVVFFTDGTPGGSGWSDDVANAAIKEAHSLKEKATVYSVSVYPDGDGKMHKYMNYVSSNYTVVPKANDNYLDGTATPSDGKNEKVHDKYFLSTSPQELEKIFREISEDVGDPTGGAGYKFEESDDVRVKDIVTPAFNIPEGAELTIYQIPIKKSTNTQGWDFDEESKTIYTPKDGDLVLDPSTKTVVLKGYNFSEHWCGLKKFYEKNADGSQGDEILDRREFNKKGAMLRIQFEIVENPDCDGGYMYTNDPSSGVYVNGESTAVVEYTMPNPVVDSEIDLVIQRPDLNEGESTIYLVTREGDPNFSRRVAVTAVKQLNNSIKAETRLRVKYSNEGSMYTYKVEEEHTWDWTTVHTDSSPNVMSKVLVDPSLHNDNYFVFMTERPTEDLPKHDETFVEYK